MSFVCKSNVIIYAYEEREEASGDYQTAADRRRNEPCYRAEQIDYKTNLNVNVLV